MKVIKYSTKDKERALKMHFVDGLELKAVALKMKCNLCTIYRWRALYDGSPESLQSKSSRPKTLHPAAHTSEETGVILKVLEEYPNIGYSELYGVLRTNYAYSRHFKSMYHYIRKNNLRAARDYTVYEPKPYDTPGNIGDKWQMDVKYVPRNCNKGEHSEIRFYQFTVIDEATRKRFIYPYRTRAADSTVDFVKRAVAFFGYIPLHIQTDNGLEFRLPYHARKGTVHKLDELCGKLGILHTCIKPRTPRHNGKVERSHRSDQERFYNFLKFKNYEDLKSQMCAYLIRSNSIPTSALRDTYGKQRYQSPNDKERELMEVINGSGNAQGLRLVNS